MPPMPTPMPLTILAIAALIGLCRPALPAARSLAYAKVVAVESAAVDLDPLLVVALVDHESRWNEKAVSKDGKASVGRPPACEIRAGVFWKPTTAPGHGDGSRISILRYHDAAEPPSLLHFLHFPRSFGSEE